MGIIDTLRDVVTLVQKADNIELNQKVLELQAEVGNLIGENHRLNEEVRGLQEKLRVKDALTFEDNLYWLDREDGREGPFCTKCWDADSNLVRLHRMDEKNLRCPSCEKSPPGHWQTTYA